MTEREIFTAALNKADPAERAAFLDEQCSGNAPLRQRIESLLAEHDQLGSFMDVPSSAATIDHPAQRLGTIIGPYKLLQQIGEGGMGVVYMAEQSKPVERRVAIKIIKPGMDTRQVIARFEAERQALAMMDHPNIAKVLEAGTTESGRPYFVMELVKGIPITRYCDEKHLSLQERLKLMIPVCQAIQHAHQKGIIHRDIKPTNVLVAQYDGRPVPKVIDFGVAKATAQKLTERTMFTELGQVVGTVEYMSPEQAELNQLDIDTRSDIYSLGVLLYELLAGTTPFDRQKLRSAAFHEMLRIIREDEPPKPSISLSTSGTLASISANRQTDPARLSKDVRGELDWIVMKALEKDRNRRYETANGLASDIQRYLNDEAVQACPPSARYRFGKFVRKNRATLSTAAIVALALLVGTGVSTWQAVRATSAESVARANETQARNAAAAELAAKQAETIQRKRAEANEQRALKAAEAERKAKQAEAAQRRRAETGERKAEKNFESALEAVDRLLAHVGTNELNDVPRIQPVRRKILRDAVEYYERFLVESEDSAAIRFRMAKTWASMARLCTQLGDYDAAKEAYEPALAAFRQLVATEPSRDHREALADCLVSVGYFHQWVFPEREKMEASFREASEHYEKLAKDHPQSTDFERRKSIAENELIRSQVAAGGRDVAIVHTRRTIALLEDSKGATGRERGRAWRQLGELLAPIDSTGADDALRRAIIEYRAWVNKSSDDRGQFAQLLRFAGTHLAPRSADEAIEYFCESELLSVALIDDYPTNPHFRMHLAWTLRNFARLRIIQAQGEAAQGNAAAATTHLAEADAKYDTAIEILRQLVGDFPDKHNYQAELIKFRSEHARQIAESNRSIGEILNNRARVLAISPDLELRDGAQAVQLAEQAIKLNPNEGKFWNTLGAARYRAGDWQGAIAALGKSQELQRANEGFDWFFLAMAHWQLGEKEQAQKWYERAVEWMGMFEQQNDEVRRFRAEASELLGIKDEPKQEEKPPPKPDKG